MEGVFAGCRFGDIVNLRRGWQIRRRDADVTPPSHKKQEIFRWTAAPIPVLLVFEAEFPEREDFGGKGRRGHWGTAPMNHGREERQLSEIVFPNNSS